MEESAVPAIASVAEVPRVLTRGSSNRLTMTIHCEKLYIITMEGRNCHVFTYSINISSSMKKTCFIFDEEVETAEFYGQYSNSICAAVVTSDGRLWLGCLNSLEKRTFSREDFFTEYPYEPRLLAVNILSVCDNYKEGPLVAMTNGAATPQLLWLGTGLARTVPGLEHIHSPITSILLIFRDMVSPTFWTALTRVPTCDEDVESLLLLGFADGAVRSCLITESKTLYPVHLLVRLDSIEQQVLSILVFTNASNPLIDTLCFVGKKGAVSILEESSSFRHVLGGLRSKGPWLSAKAIHFDDKKGIVAIRQDGKSHLLALENGVGKGDSMTTRLPVREGMMTVTSCASFEGGSWLAFGTAEGSLLLMHIATNNFEKLLAWSQDESSISTSFLDAVTARSQIATTRSRTHYLLQRLRQLKDRAEDSPTHDENDFQRAVDETKLVLKLGCESNNQVSNVVISEVDASVTLQGTTLNDMLPPLPGQRWTSSLHACLVIEGDCVAVGGSPVCRTVDDEDELPIHYEGIAVTETRHADTGDGLDQTMSLKKDCSRVVDSFLSISACHESK